MSFFRNGGGLGLAGVTIFSGSLPATRIAVSAFDPLVLTCLRALLAGLIALVILRSLRVKIPARVHLPGLLLVMGGVVIGFPLLTALAVQKISSAHALVYMGMLPLLTALFSVLRTEERPPARFWFFSLTGSLVIAGYAIRQSGTAVNGGDLMMLAAITVCGLGYAEGARLARALGSWQVTCWALVLSLPISLPSALYWHPDTLDQIGLPAWLGLGYVTLFSMLIGFFFWYAGLARGGIAAVGQLQLLQPFLGFLLAFALLDETVTPAMLLVAGAVLVCVAGARSATARPQPK